MFLVGRLEYNRVLFCVCSSRGAGADESAGGGRPTPGGALREGEGGVALGAEVRGQARLPRLDGRHGPGTPQQAQGETGTSSRAIPHDHG